MHETYKQPDDEETNNFGLKYRNEENTTKKPNGSTTWEKSYKDSKKNRRRKWTSIHTEVHSKKYLTGKRQATMADIDNGYKNHFYPWQTIKMNRCLLEKLTN